MEPKESREKQKGSKAKQEGSLVEQKGSKDEQEGSKEKQEGTKEELKECEEADDECWWDKILRQLNGNETDKEDPSKYNYGFVFCMIDDFSEAPNKAWFQKKE